MALPIPTKLPLTEYQLTVHCGQIFDAVKVAVVQVVVRLAEMAGGMAACKVVANT